MKGPPASSRPRGVVLDIDGVLLDSAVVHAAAWKTAFDACLGELGPEAGSGRRSTRTPSTGGSSTAGHGTTEPRRS
ncbi:hypothetical protein RGF97_31670 [Streptomyces roseicoloratus]|uniref:Hydrolase n=1 Tax=Streptomyces roseicoloratus TaxID=2508722 RepID=A0ABY9S2I8_9ACTN|nr:hypothetical protein [Streptomyces roseicoloratus]WMX48452.1 hypothetical protein RGF97_31670 [Streptomyces roseicoloratus]